MQYKPNLKISLFLLVFKGSHIGHRVWNPNIREFLIGSRNKLTIIDSTLTFFMLKRALMMMNILTYFGGRILFIIDFRFYKLENYVQLDQIGQKKYILDIITKQNIKNSLTKNLQKKNKMPIFIELDKIRKKNIQLILYKFKLIFKNYSTFYDLNDNKLHYKKINAFSRLKSVLPFLHFNIMNTKQFHIESNLNKIKFNKYKNMYNKIFEKRIRQSVKDNFYKIYFTYLTKEINSFGISLYEQIIIKTKKNNTLINNDLNTSHNLLNELNKKLKLNKLLLNFELKQKQDLNQLHNYSNDFKHYFTDRWFGGIISNFKKIFIHLKAKTRKKHRLTNKIKNFFKYKYLFKRFPSSIFLINAAFSDSASNEARKVKIPSIGLTDSNGDYIVDYPIPCNDDSSELGLLLLHAIIDTNVKYFYYRNINYLIDWYQLIKINNEEYKEIKYLNKKPTKIKLKNFLQNTFEGQNFYFKMDLKEIQQLKDEFKFILKIKNK